MLGFGTTDDHGNAKDFGDLFAAMTKYTISFWIVVNTVPTATRDVFGKWHSTAASQEWVVQINSDLKVIVQHHDGTAAASATVSTTAIILSEPTHVTTVWDGTNLTYHLNGVVDNSPPFSTAIRNASGTNLAVGARNGSNDKGIACDLGEVMLWKDEALADADIAAVYAGEPASLNTMDFWYRGLSTDDPEFFGNAVSGTRSTVTSAEHQLGTCAFMPHGRFYDNTVPGAANIKVVNDYLGVQDGDNNDLDDPSGFLDETMTDGTIWRTLYPPFTKRTQWT